MNTSEGEATGWETTCQNFSTIIRLRLTVNFPGQPGLVLPLGFPTLDLEEIFGCTRWC